MDYKIIDTQCEFEIFKLYSCLEDKYVDKIDDIGLCESNLLHYIFPQTFHAPEFTKRCQTCYFPNQRAIIAPTGEILFTITAQSIDQMMQAPSVENITPFSLEALTELYQNLDFSKRAKIFDIFLQENTKLPKKNLAHPSSIFIEQEKQIIIVISYILGYYYD